MSRLAPILVVDDDYGIRSSICDALALTGYPVVSAGHGGIALDIVEHKRVAHILLDMNMPVIDGWTFVREYRAAYTQCAPIVVLTAAHSAATWAAMVDATAYLAKPFELDELLRIVERHALRPESGLA